MTNAMPLDIMFDRMRTISRAMDEVLRAERPVVGATVGRNGTVHWLPSVDIYQTDEAFVIEADLPGVRREDLDLDYEQGVLTIRGARTMRDGEARRRTYASERLHGRFARSVKLPEWADAEHAEATYVDGVLRVVLPKAAAARPMKIAIRGETQPAIAAQSEAGN